MKKLILLLIFIFSMFVAYSQGVSVTINAPDSVKYGEKILVNVTVDKGTVNGFARFFASVLPEFKATIVKNEEGEGTVDNQGVNIKWMRMPYKSKLELAYYLEIPEYASDTFELMSQFSFISDNRVQLEKAEPKRIKVINAINHYKKSNTVQVNKISCVRRKPIVEDNGEIIIAIELYKEGVENFGKIQENIPEGYKAMALQNKDAIFTVKDSVLKFIWLDLPKEDLFVVTYKLIPKKGTENVVPNISGKFYYSNGNGQQEVDIIQNEN